MEPAPAVVDMDLEDVEPEPALAVAMDLEGVELTRIKKQEATNTDLHVQVGPEKERTNYTIIGMESDPDVPQPYKVPILSVFKNDVAIHELLLTARSRILHGFNESFGGEGESKMTSMENVVRFIDIYILLRGGKLKVYFANAYLDKRGGDRTFNYLGQQTPWRLLDGSSASARSSPLSDSEFEGARGEAAKVNILQYVVQLIKNAGLDDLIKNAWVQKGHCVKITLDYYTGRPAGDKPGFHKDTTEESNTAYVFLSFLNEGPLHGPEVLALQINEEAWRKGDTALAAGKVEEVPVKALFRPEIPSGDASGVKFGGTIGFNDKLLSHSSPASEQGMLEVSQPIAPGLVAPVIRVTCECAVGGTPEVSGPCILRFSHSRKPLSKGQRPDFVRTWIQPLKETTIKIPDPDTSPAKMETPEGMFLANSDFELLLDSITEYTKVIHITETPQPNISKYLSDNGDSIFNYLGSSKDFQSRQRRKKSKKDKLKRKKKKRKREKDKNKTKRRKPKRKSRRKPKGKSRE